MDASSPPAGPPPPPGSSRRVSARRARTFGGRVLIGIVVGTVLMAAAVLGVDREVSRRLDSIPKLALSVAPERPGGANYLVVGSDTRAFVDSDLAAGAFGDAASEGGQRSDTIMVVHVEPDAERSIVVSFPRDLWVNIPGRGYAKINAAYNYGPQTLIDTIQQNFGVEINHYVELDFQSFIDLVDALGGATVYVPYEAKDEYTGLGLPSGGCWNFNGVSALQWVRSRSLQFNDPNTGRWVYADVVPDIGRIGRQQEFIRLLVGLAVQKSLSNPFTANMVAATVVTNLKVDEGFDKESIFALIDAFRTIDANDASSLEFVTMPWRTGPNQGAQSVLYANLDLAGPLLARLNTFDERSRVAPDPATVRVRVINQSGRPDLGVAVKQRLTELGYVVVGVDETSVVTASGSTVAFAPDQVAKAKLLLRYVEPQAVLGAVDPSLVGAGADVSLLLTKTFETIVVPADRFQVPVTTTVDPATPVDGGALDVPIAQAPVPEPVRLGDPAPRVGC